MSREQTSKPSGSTSRRNVVKGMGLAAAAGLVASGNEAKAAAVGPPSTPLVDFKDGKVTFPSTYDPNKGLRSGRVFELRCFFWVKPGHAEALKQACRDHPTLSRDPEVIRAAGITVEEGTNLIGIHENSATLFDNDTRFLWCTSFDSEWDPYIEDVVKLAGTRSYYNIFQHCEGVPEGVDYKTLSADYFKALFNATRETAAMYQVTVPKSLKEIRRGLKVQDAFQQVLDHPDAAKALENPALKPLLDLAAY